MYIFHHFKYRKKIQIKRQDIRQIICYSEEGMCITLLTHLLSVDDHKVLTFILILRMGPKLRRMGCLRRLVLEIEAVIKRIMHLLKSGMI